jgi:hypothetical protein
VPSQPPTPPQSAQAFRPGRALIGWMKPDQAQGLLQRTIPDPAQAAAAVQRAHQAVAARPPWVEQDALVTTVVPAELAGHASALDASPAAKPLRDEGWKIALVDLTKVCAFQPAIVSDQAVARVQTAGKDDIVSVAAITLPLTQGDQLPLQYDPVHQVWTVTSDNPNLRIAGNIAVPMTPVGTGLGFAVVAAPSFMQVGRYRGRHFLRDGYHRAFGLLSRRITIVPAFVRDITVFEELLPDPRVQLPQDSYLGQQPPVLTDYLDDSVSAAVDSPAVRKTVLVQGLELHTPAA